MQRKPNPKRDNSSKKQNLPIQKATKAPREINHSTDGKSKWNLPLIVVLVLTIVTYGQVFGFFYLNWDDNLNVTENQNVINFTWDKIGSIFSLETGTIIGNYNPLPILSFAIEKIIYGSLNARLAHGINLAFHLGCVYLVYRLFLGLKFQANSALFIALLFGIHPMRVESVAWVTERKDVMFALFYLLALVQYVKWIQANGNKKHYILMILFAVFALFSKVQAVSLPLTMLAIDYWLRRPNPVKLVVEKTPFWILSMAFGLLNIYSLRTYGSLGTSVEGFNFMYGIGIAATSFVTYLYKVIVPYPMSPLYPFPSELTPIAYLCIALTIAVIAALIAFRKKEAARIWIFGIGFFAVNVVFVLQFINAGQGYMADRFTYISYIGLFAILAWYLQQWNSQPARKVMAQSITFGFAGICVILTYIQLPIWKDSGTLWTHVISTDGGSKIPLPYINRGIYYRSVQQHDLAVQDLAKAIEVKPDEAQAYLAMGKTYFDQGVQKNPVDQTLLLQSIQWYDRGIAVPKLNDADKVNLVTNKATSYAALGQNDKALAEYANAERIDSNLIEIYLNRSLVYANAKQFAEALKDYDHIIRMGAANADIYYERGLCHGSLKDQNAAIRDFTSAIRLEPAFANAYLERARAYITIGKKEEAQSDLKMSLKHGGNPGPELRKQVGI